MCTVWFYPIFALRYFGGLFLRDNDGDFAAYYNYLSKLFCLDVLFAGAGSNCSIW